MEVTIEKLVYGGEGLARVEGPDGRRKTVFVPFVLPGERAEITISEERSGFARGELLRIVAPVSERTSPSCRYFGECGGCHYQHATYEAQLDLKKHVLRETVQRISKVELPEITSHPSPPLHYRNRTRLRVGTDSEDKFALGYYRCRSHSLIAVRECPISSPLINLAIQAVWSVADQKLVPAGLAEIEFFADSSDAKFLVELIVQPNANTPALRGFGGDVRSTLSEVVGVAAIPLARRTENETVGAPELDGEQIQTVTLLSGEKELEYRVGSDMYSVSAGAFFQTNRFLTEQLVELATAGLSGNHALDLYAGVGLFTLPLAKRFQRVTAVEASPASFESLSKNVPPNVRARRSTTEAFLTKSSVKADFVVVDPPRSGLGNRVATALAKMNPSTISYVSCDPSTLARDLAVLLAAGYKITQAHLIDLFPQTFHIETVLRLER
jgi:23S rRNA (uracil1939-C5)-methyltransferase